MFGLPHQGNLGKILGRFEGTRVVNPSDYDEVLISGDRFSRRIELLHAGSVKVAITPYIRDVEGIANLLRELRTKIGPESRVEVLPANLPSNKDEDEVILEATVTSAVVMIEGRPCEVRRGRLIVTRTDVIEIVDINVGSVFRERLKSVVLHRIPIAKIRTFSVAPREFLDGPWLQLSVEGETQVIKFQTPDAPTVVQVLEQVRGKVPSSA